MHLAVSSAEVNLPSLIICANAVPLSPKMASCASRLGTEAGFTPNHCSAIVLNSSNKMAGIASGHRSNKSRIEGNEAFVSWIQRVFPRTSAEAAMVAVPQTTGRAT